MGLKRLKSLREFIEALEEIGEVQPIEKEVDWNLEIGAVTRRSYELRAPAPLFNPIRGIDRGFRVLGAPGGLSAGGRYIQTYGMNIVCTPDRSWTNWSINRMMLVDRNRLACLIPPKQHLGIIHAKWKALGKPTPIVVAFGVEPALPFVGGMSAPEGVDESHLLGAYFGEPVEVVRGETVDLPVPATAEIVVGGHISHDDVVTEGPMGEYPG